MNIEKQAQYVVTFDESEFDLVKRILSEVSYAFEEDDTCPDLGEGMCGATANHAELVHSIAYKFRTA